MADVIPIRPDDAAAQERLPPNNIDAEATVLGEIILGGRAQFDRVKDFLLPEHFFSEAHRRIFEAMVGISETSDPIDMTQLLVRLKQTDRISQVGGAAYVTEMLNAVPAVIDIVPHARAVYDRWRERQAIAACQRIAAQGYIGVTDSQEYLDSATRSLSAIAMASISARLESNTEAIQRTLKRAADRSTAATKIPLGLATGIASFDDEWGGLHGTDLSVFLAKKGTGKTSLALQLLNSVTKQKVAVLMFSSDSTHGQLIDQLISHEAKVDSRRLAKGTLAAEEWRRLAAAGSDLGTRTYFLDDARSLHIGQVRARALATADECLRRLRVPLGLVIFDYYQQLKNHSGNAYAKKVDWLNHAAEQLKSLALAMKIPVVVLAQQKPDDRGEPVYAAKECAKIEDEADNLYVIEKIDRDRRRLRPLKVRRGDDPILELAFDGPSRTFSDAKLEAASRDYVDQGPPLWPEEDEGR